MSVDSYVGLLEDSRKEKEEDGGDGGAGGGAGGGGEGEGEGGGEGARGGRFCFLGSRSSFSFPRSACGIIF
jgi:hypothetical protein